MCQEGVAGDGGQGFGQPCIVHDQQAGTGGHGGQHAPRLRDTPVELAKNDGAID